MTVNDLQKMTSPSATTSACVHPLARENVRASTAPPTTILVVDADPVARAAIVRRLTSTPSGLHIVQAETAADALTTLKARVLDGVLLDVEMPNVDMCALIRGMRALQLSLPIFVMLPTGSRARGDAMIEAGASDHVVKSDLTAALVCHAVRYARRLAEVQQRSQSIEANLRRSKRRMSSLLEVTTVLTWWTDGNGAIVRECAPWGDFTGQRFEDYRGWGWIDAVHPDDRAQVAEVWRTALAVRCKYECRYRLLRHDGEYRHTVARGIPQLEADGSLIEWIGSNTDVTEERLRVQEAERRAEFEQQLIGIVSHDLRAPLSAVVMGVQLLEQSEGLSEQARVIVSRLISSSRRATKLIDDLLDFTRARLGQGIPVQLCAGDLHDIARRTVEELQSAHPERSIVFEHEGDGHGHWDHDRLAQVLSNLATNGLKYGDPAGRIHVTSRGERHHAVLAVHNWGNPIDSSIRSELFEPFRQGARRPVVARNSLGLGLYIVHEIVRAHGGEVRVESSAEHGTCFEVRLPRDP